MKPYSALRTAAYFCPFSLLFFLALAAGRPARRAVAHWSRRGAPGRRAETRCSRAGPSWWALLLSMDPDWHVYWKNPGDSGLPTTVDWDLPPGFTAGPLQWPVPERFESDGLVTYGYSGKVLLFDGDTPARDCAQPGTPVVSRRARGGLPAGSSARRARLRSIFPCPVSAGMPGRGPALGGVVPRRARHASFGGGARRLLGGCRPAHRHAPWHRHAARRRRAVEVLSRMHRAR